MILDNFPKVLWINLERSVDRRRYMENLLNQYKLSHTRIEAVDGFSIHNKEYVSCCRRNRSIRNVENACTCSHLKALKFFLEKMDDERIVVFEDDVTFEFLEYIPFNWSEFEKNLPRDYHVVQLAIFSTTSEVECKLVKWNPQKKYYGTVAYLMKRVAAEKLLKIYFSERLRMFDLSDKIALADMAIYSIGHAYSIPIFSYLANSIIHPSFNNQYMIYKTLQKEVWKKISEDKNFNLKKIFELLE
ncbi:MAG: glycosyltransferase family 25 protein [Thermoplasmata archaeon]